MTLTGSPCTEKWLQSGIASLKRQDRNEFWGGQFDGTDLTVRENFRFLGNKMPVSFI